MAKVLGFQIEIQGTQRAISTSEELRRAIDAGTHFDGANYEVIVNGVRKG